MQQPDPGLAAAIADLAATARQRVFSLDYGGQRYWVKRPGLPRLRSSVFMQSCIALAFGLAMLKPPRDGNLKSEAIALRHLAANGWPVPALVIEEPRWLVLGDGGASVETLLNQETDPLRRRALIEACADLLLRLHRQGEWHGGAQIRNFSWRDDQPGLLDLEDHDLPGMNLAQRQARDLLLFLYSLTRYDKDASAPLLPALAKRLVHGAEPETRAEIARLHRRIGPIIRLAKPFAAKAGRDVRQGLAAEAAIAAALS
ncbi:hypothetical protein [Ferrovibrio sp.]|uniref:hypothetical protein n=1 Tax=Ferrovibrio sp. TaxID=1917215 RepID=UPI003D2B0F7D